MAREAGIALDIDDFDVISSKTPILADLKPGGRYVAADVDRVGGNRVLARRLVEAGYVDGSTPTVSGRTLGEEAGEAGDAPDQDVIRTVDDPVKDTGGLVILKGNVAPEGQCGQDRGPRAPLP